MCLRDNYDALGGLAIRDPGAQVHREAQRRVVEEVDQIHHGVLEGRQPRARCLHIADRHPDVAVE